MYVLAWIAAANGSVVLIWLWAVEQSILEIEAQN